MHACVVSGRRNRSVSVKLYRTLPANNPELLRKWIANIGRICVDTRTCSDLSDSGHQKPADEVPTITLPKVSLYQNPTQNHSLCQPQTTLAFTSNTAEGLLCKDSQSTITLSNRGKPKYM